MEVLFLGYNSHEDCNFAWHKSQDDQEEYPIVNLWTASFLLDRLIARVKIAFSQWSRVDRTRAVVTGHLPHDLRIPSLPFNIKKGFSKTVDRPGVTVFFIRHGSKHTRQQYLFKIVTNETRENGRWIQTEKLMENRWKLNGLAQMRHWDRNLGGP